MSRFSIQTIQTKTRKMNWAMALVFVLMTVMSVAMPVSADIGPKESTKVSVEGVPDDQVYYATLLSDVTGRAGQDVFEGDPRTAYDSKDEGREGPSISYRDVWLAFVEFEDPDGYYYLQQDWKLEGSDTFEWGYYPPDSFKVLLYFPEYNSFVISEIAERFAFDSVFKVNLRGMDYRTPGSVLVVQAEPVKQLDLSWIMEVAVRIILTILIEVGIAKLFFIREHDQLVFIAKVNLGTQIILNAVLLCIRFFEVLPPSFNVYLLIELGIFLIEAVVYAKYLNRFSDKPIKCWHAVIYAFVANVVTFFAGQILEIIFWLVNPH